MPNIRPEDFALRAINQYRKRDIFPYLGLRYYLENRCARRDRWSCEIAAHLVLTRDDYNYFQVSHFKDIEELQGVTHRSIFIPGPNEALVEVALLAECAKYPEVFGNYSCTFSYDLVGVKSREGMFKSYFPGFQQRHRRVASSCRTTNAEQVFYTDIKGFYPNITYDLALKSWREACNKANMASMFRELGEKLLLDYNVQSLRLSSGECRGVLTGPMFSHLIGNLVLKSVDNAMIKKFPNQYFRYVDDIIMIGSSKNIQIGRQKLSSTLSDLNLELHDGDKDFQITASHWLEGEMDFEEEVGETLNWKTFIGDLKRLLILKPDQVSNLKSRLEDQGFRIPLLDYSTQINEKSYLDKLSGLLKIPWLNMTARSVTVDRVLRQGKQLRSNYCRELREYLDQIDLVSGYNRKRLIPKIRFLAGRLSYLGTNEMLNEFQGELKNIKETYLLANVYRAIIKNDVTELLPLGLNAVQSAAQILATNKSTVSCNIQSLSAVERQGVAVLKINDIGLDFSNKVDLNDEIIQFANWEGDMSRLPDSKCNFVQEISCLHGIKNKRRHSIILRSAFDEDESLAFDALNQLQQSDYG